MNPWFLGFSQDISELVGTSLAVDQLALTALTQEATEGHTQLCWAGPAYYYFNVKDIVVQIETSLGPDLDQKLAVGDPERRRCLCFNSVSLMIYWSRKIIYFLLYLLFL